MQYAQLDRLAAHIASMLFLNKIASLPRLRRYQGRVAAKSVKQSGKYALHSMHQFLDAKWFVQIARNIQLTRFAFDLG